jgi:hypothetical protein
MLWVERTAASEKVPHKQSEHIFLLPLFWMDFTVAGLYSHLLLDNQHNLLSYQ